MQTSTPSAIGIVSYDYAPAIGGLGILAQTYVQELRRKHPDVAFITISPSRDADERGSILGRFRWKKSGGCPLFSLSLFFTLPRLIRKLNLDVVHVHAGSGGVFLLRRLPCRVVVTSHHTYSQEARLVFKQLAWKKFWKKFMSRLERRTYVLADKICCASDDTRRELVQHYRISPEKIAVVENPISTDILKQFRREKRSDATILFVGRLEERKGIMILLEAFRQLSTEMPLVRLRLVGRNLIGQPLHSFIKIHHLESRIDVIGYVHDSLRFQEMARATVLVVPSLLEGFGLVAAEAMLLGTSVVASDAPGLRSIVEDGTTGFVFRSGDSSHLVQVVRRALTHPAQREAVEREAQITAEKRFSLEARAADMMTALSDSTN